MTAPAQWGGAVDWQALTVAPLGPPDPYLLWARWTQWSHFGLQPGQGVGAKAMHQVPLLVQLKPGKTVAALRTACEPLGAYLPALYTDATAGTPAGAVVTLWLDRALFDQPERLAPLAPLVARIEMAAPVKAPGPPVDPATGDDVDQSPAPALRGSVLLGVIDSGCPFAHPRLHSALGTRIGSVWSVGQRGWLHAAPGHGGVPRGFSHGHAVARQAQGGPGLDSWLAQQPTWPGGLRDGIDLALRAVPPAKAGGPARARRPGELARLAGRANHGAAVLDLLCGPVRPRDRLAARSNGLGLDPDGAPSWRPASDVCADPQRSDVVFVDLPSREIHDSTGGWLGPQVLDGVQHIVDCAVKGQTEHIVVNVSYGGTTGPHDGSSLLDQALVALCEREPRLHLVLAAGNSFDKRLHAVLEPRPKKPAALNWFVPPGNEKPAFMELWLASEDDAALTEFELTSPGGASVTLRAGEVRPLLEGGQAVAWALYLRQCSRGHGAMLLLAVAPTDTTRQPGRAAAPHGLWQVQARCQAKVGEIHAWVARGERDRGLLPQGRHSHLVDPRDEPSRALRSNRDDPGRRPDDIDDAAARQGSVLRRRGTLSSIAGARHARIHVIAGYVLHSGEHAPYSSAGDGRSARGVGPTAAAPSDESRVLPGLRVAGSQGAAVTRLVGTSAAAPIYARALAARLAAGQAPARPAPAARAPNDDQDDLFGPGGRHPVAKVPLA